jgi:hypothetical protein
MIGLGKLVKSMGIGAIHRHHPLRQGHYHRFLLGNSAGEKSLGLSRGIYGRVVAYLTIFPEDFMHKRTFCDSKIIFEVLLKISLTRQRRRSRPCQLSMALPP